MKHKPPTHTQIREDVEREFADKLTALEKKVEEKDIFIANCKRRGKVEESQ